jgi:ABC-type histidine transport system ATPase subunit
VADEVVFMDGGVIAERGAPSEILRNPRRADARILTRVL